MERKVDGRKVHGKFTSLRSGQLRSIGIIGKNAASIISAEWKLKSPSEKLAYSNVLLLDKVGIRSDSSRKVILKKHALKKEELFAKIAVVNVDGRGSTRSDSAVEAEVVTDVVTSVESVVASGNSSFVERRKHIKTSELNIYKRAWCGRERKSMGDLSAGDLALINKEWNLMDCEKRKVRI